MRSYNQVSAAHRMPEEIKGWVLYDGTCGFCSRWVPFWENALRKRGFRIAPLQTDWVAEKFKLSEDELSSDFRLLLANGEKVAGAEVYRYLMRRIWWAMPFYFLSTLPVLRGLFDAAYRGFADNRYWISRTCHMPARRHSK
jgi:predicted DCC family thiol-disulfide oxidoreductase YuxK